MKKLIGLGLVSAALAGALVFVPSIGRRPLESKRVGGDAVALLEQGRALDVADYAGTLKPQREYGQSAPASWRGAIRSTLARVRPADAKPSLLNPGVVVRQARPTAKPVRAFAVPALAGAR